MKAKQYKTLKGFYETYKAEHEPGDCFAISYRYQTRKGREEKAHISLETLSRETIGLLMKADLIRYEIEECEYFNLTLSGREAGRGTFRRWAAEIDSDQAMIALETHPLINAPKRKPKKPKTKAEKLAALIDEAGGKE